MVDDAYQNFGSSPASPAESAFSIAPSDTLELSRATKALYIGGAGDLVVIALRDSATVTFRNLAAGTILDLRVKSVLAAGTTATNIVGLT